MAQRLLLEGEVLNQEVHFVQQHRPAFAQLPKFPAAERDLSVVVRDDVSHSAIAQEIIAVSLVENVEFFDLYEGEPIESGHKSLSFSIRLRHPERTLKDKQADAAINEILKKLQKPLKLLEQIWLQ